MHQNYNKQSQKTNDQVHFISTLTFLNLLYKQYLNLWLNIVSSTGEVSKVVGKFKTVFRKVLSVDNQANQADHSSLVQFKGH